jgi:RNA polymerase sigma-70 factor (ECF subfamily)
MNDADWLAERFEQHRPRLRAVAYRMLGSLAEADDAVQDTWLRLSRAGTDGVENLGGWLTTIVARVCLNQLRSRRLRREHPLEAHVPDPVLSRDGEAQPEDQALLADSLGLALLVVLDTLSPDERLAFVLHDMFDLPFKDIAGLIGRTPAAAKQLASRARRRVRSADIPAEHDRVREREVVDAFFSATGEGDFGRLVAVLHPDVLLRTDGGTGHPEASMVIRGSAAVAGQAVKGFRRIVTGPGAGLRRVLVNGSAGAIVMADGQPLIVIGFTVSGGQITGIDAITDPARVPEITVGVLGQRLASSATEALVSVQGQREEDGDEEQRPGHRHDDRVAGDPGGMGADGVPEKLAGGSGG